MISINEMIENMPEGLSQLEKTRYIYLELGKIFSYNLDFFYTEDDKTLQDIYDEEITVDRIEKGEYKNKVRIVCKQAAEILCEVLNKIGIKAYCIGIEKGEINHVDVIVEIENKNFCLDIINDMKNIQKGFSTKSFGKKDIILPSNSKCDTIDDEETKRIIMGGKNKTSRKDIEKLNNIQTLTITFSFIIDTYKISK